VIRWALLFKDSVSEAASSNRCCPRALATLRLAGLRAASLVNAMRNKSHARLLWILLIATLIYWAICAVVSPVTTWDSQVYNLGRLAIADIGGFWSNRCWFSERQVIFPWVFDAVHYPFVKAGLCESIPSFLTLIGLLIIVYKLTREWYSESFALWSCLSLISMPTLIYQATSTKNDFVMVFLVACWFYALHRYQRERSVWLLVASGLSLGFLGGSKTSGLFFCAILLFLTLFVLRRHINAFKWFVASFAVSIILFGSVETYALSDIRYGDPFGPPAFVRMHSNRDGIRGAIANFARYYIGSFSCGIYTGFLQQSFCVNLENSARLVLNAAGLANAGYRSDFNDGNLKFEKTGGDDGSDYGIFGWVAFTTSLVIPFFAPRKSRSRSFAIAGLASLGLICVTVGWMPWNARFLLLPFALFAIATMIFAFHDIVAKSFRRFLQILILFQIAVTPIISWARKPTDLLRSIFNREELVFSERPTLLPVYHALESLTVLRPRIYLMAGPEAWVLEFLKMRNIDWKLTCTWPATVADEYAGPVYLLVLDCKAPAGLDSEETTQFDSGNSLWTIRR